MEVMMLNEQSSYLGWKAHIDSAPCLPLSPRVLMGWASEALFAISTRIL
jgi:hypothetical protein